MIFVNIQRPRVAGAFDASTILHPGSSPISLDISASHTKDKCISALRCFLFRKTILHTVSRELLFSVLFRVQIFKNCYRREDAKVVAADRMDRMDSIPCRAS